MGLILLEILRLAVQQWGKRPCSACGRYFSVLEGRYYRCDQCYCYLENTRGIRIGDGSFAKPVVERGSFCDKHGGCPHLSACFGSAAEG